MPEMQKNRNIAKEFAEGALGLRGKKIKPSLGDELRAASGVGRSTFE